MDRAFFFPVFIARPENNAKNSAPQSVNYCVTDFRRTPVRLQICSLQFALCSTAFFALFSGLAIDGSAGELIHPFFPPEKQCHGSRPGMAADGGSDAVDLDFSVQIGKAFLDKIRNGPRIFVAGGLGNVAFAGVGEAALGVFFHLVDDFFDDFFLRTDFEPRNQPSFVVHVEQRADAEESADCAGGFGDAAAAHVEGEVRGEEPVMDFEAVFHRKIVNLFQRFSFIAQIGKAVHQKTIAGGSAEGIHDEDFPFRVALFKVGFGDHRRIQDTGNAGGEADVENVFAVLQECFKIGFKFIGIHLGCFRGSAGGHGGIELIERHGLAEIIRVLGVI